MRDRVTAPIVWITILAALWLSPTDPLSTSAAGLLWVGAYWLARLALHKIHVRRLAGLCALCVCLGGFAVTVTALPKANPTIDEPDLRP